MNKKIETLLKEIETAKNQAREVIDIKKVQLQKEFNKMLDNDISFQKALNNAENASDYQYAVYCNVESWFRYLELDDVPEEHREYFEEYVSDKCISIDWNNSCFLMNQGDCLIIQDDTRRDNGVWLNGKIVIDESEYKVEGDVDEDLRNSLIEAYMEKSGFFPGVFRVTQHGDVFLVNTTPKGKK